MWEEQLVDPQIDTTHYCMYSLVSLLNKNKNKALQIVLNKNITKKIKIKVKICALDKAVCWISLH